MLCWKFGRAAQNTGDLSKKTWLSWKGISFLQITFMLFGMKETLIWFNLQKERTINRLLHIKDAFAESVQLQMSVLLHRGMCMVKAGLSGLSDGWANIKKKYLANTAILKLHRKISLQITGFCFDWWILLLLKLKSITHITQLPYYIY